MYTLREFRANTKEAFDKAAGGETVTIKRGGQFFELKPVHEFTAHVEPKATVFITQQKYCKNGHPMDSRGRCFGKGCKYGV